MVMPEGVSEFLELIKDPDVAPGFFQFPALVKYLLDVTFGTGSGNDLTRHLLKPFKAFPGHSLRKDRHRFTTKQ